MKEITFYFDPQLFVLWKEKALAKAWAQQYPQLFDSVDLEIALNQPQYHFYEWLSAIRWYEYGYYSLVEQYIYSRHVRKADIIARMLGDNAVSLLKERSKFFHAQPPDLFVFNETAFFFVECKSPTDFVRAEQSAFFKEIEEIFQTEVLICKLAAAS